MVRLTGLLQWWPFKVFSFPIYLYNLNDRYCYSVSTVGPIVSNYKTLVLWEFGE